ncbi:MULTISPECIES: Csu type fimbrial protein [Pseudomonas]|uniref:Fimbrial major subunit CsuA/B family protein n=1 Tax=Pseudomonas poae TaxID=200451 RepID=A0AAP2WH97_9PSED|nr:MULTISPECIES: spore coat U domain-containing protein [Pseudomonas]ELQ10470.1 type I pilus protein CsuB, putative [Pseudomonas fluorescens BRIP34879]KTC35660.1 spore coat protein [Pseudomonas sp. ABAC21]AGE26394.1 type I pilus protein CsuB [Pseudomonas poae RE*1-1-14]MBC3196658.1 spore coat protein U domain-containing protein [Pseudomonas poae]MCF5657140.1 fimbrial major subunit CsuA/B family protein [Pseudomonas poae]
MWRTALLAFGLVLPLPLAAVTNQSFQVSATITPGCLIVGGGVNYGSLNYGSYSALATSTVTAALTGGITLQCTPGVALSVSVDGGLHSTSGRNLKHSSGSAQVGYQLFRDAAFSQSLGVSQSVSVSYSDASNIRLPIYGRVVLPGNQPNGTYSDTLQVQLSW